MFLTRFIITIFHRVTQGLASRWRNVYYRILGVKIHGYVWMRQIEITRNFQDIQIADSCALDEGVVLLCSGESLNQSKIYIGSRTYINRNTFLDATESITIGKDCAIGPGCYITDHDHGLDLEVSPLAQPMVSKPTKIGDRVWIGANVTILKGVTIGNDSVVGAGSVVTKDLPESVIAVGVPCKVMKEKVNSEIQTVT
ncbi:MAG: acyltransferase [Nostocales cyanobacterium]|nr:MAG: acyltransferase [Nostocales cyanobacterium]TAF14769.1 MAG: acyltransferase [Nostocales cyanobacterium]